MRKSLKFTLLLLTIMAAMCMFVGCGDGKQDDSALLPEQGNQSEEQSADAAGTGNDEEQVNNEKPESNTKEEQEETEHVQPEDMQNPPMEETLDKSVDASDAPTDESTELCVFVESIGDNSVVGNMISMEPGIDGNTVVMIGAGGDNKKLVSIYFADDASYVFQIIRNGDVETREGSFSDIGIDMILDLTGYYKGENFYADKVAISDVRIN